MDNSFWAMNSQPAWPVDADGKREKAVLLCRAADNTAGAEMTLSLLAAYGIPCFKYHEKDGAAGKVVSGFSIFGAGIYVPQSRLEEAADLLEADITEEKE